MNNRIFLIFLLVTPLIVIIGSTLAFNLGYSPENTKNNGIFFDSYFEVDPRSLVDESGSEIEFEDGKWVLGVYYNNDLNFENALYLMRQLNVALNRDIFKLKRIFVQSKSFQPNAKLLDDFPRIEIFNDVNDGFINQIEKIRSKNNTNWMDILRLGFKHDPKKASKIMSQIYLDDQNISKIVKKLLATTRNKK